VGEIAEQDAWIRDARGTMRDSDRDYFVVKPWRYWLDFIFSTMCAYSSAMVFLLVPIFSWTAEPWSWQQGVAWALAVFWLYRLGSLVHEVCHLQHKEMRVFKVTWNLVVGVMTLAPSPFFTRHHRDHHSRRLYGLPEDPEYVINICEPGNWRSIAKYVGLIAAFPLIVFLRFFLAPLTFITPKVRDWTLRRASSLTLNSRYERKVTAFDRKAITSVELLCWIRATAIPTVVLLGAAPWTRMPMLYFLGLSVFVLNQLRQLADHHFESNGERTAMSSHVLDSCNYTGWDPLTWLLFPFAIRYHALHHLFPSLPYHNLAAAHVYLIQNLPADSPYRDLDEPGWWSVARKIFCKKEATVETENLASPAQVDAPAVLQEEHATPAPHAEPALMK
jgi:fatty acid desaturase